MNERITEGIVRKKFDSSKKGGFVVEEQQSRNPKIEKLLRSASKKGPGAGRPDFIVTHSDDPEFLIVAECKADTAKHESPNKNQHADYAVDGALLYASYLSREYNVIALGVSGQSKNELKVSGYIHLKGASAPAANPRFNQLLSLPDYRQGYIDDDVALNQRFEDLMSYNKVLNDHLHKHKIRADERSLLFSGILIALENHAFRSSYDKHGSAKNLAKMLVNTISDQLRAANVPEDKMNVLEQSYRFILANKTLTSDRAFFVSLIRDIDTKVYSFQKTYKYYDLLGEFYIEFLRYANADKGLGIVLTPRHVTELMCDLVDVNKDSVVFDNCCGTGGFLISAMRDMIKKAGGDQRAVKRIKENQIIGVEYQGNTFTLSCSNMILNGDGKSNVYNEDCFEEHIVKEVRRKFKPTVGLLNPPYKQSPDELAFVLNNIEGLEPNALCAALVPMSCALATSGERLKLKEQLLEQHTLEAVVSLPDELFHNSKVSVVACAMVFRAHTKHRPDYKTYFGYWKNDGFVKRKNKGRIPSPSWGRIRKEWCESYRNRESTAGFSITHLVGTKDEWCAESHMKTDYSALSEDDFADTLHKYASHLLSDRIMPDINSSAFSNNKPKAVDVSGWKEFGLSDLFHIKGSKTTPLVELEAMHKEGGLHPYVTTSSENNGVAGYYPAETEDGGIITVDSAVNGYCAYQHWNFTASDHVERLIPTFSMSPYVAMFMVTIVNMETYRFNYGLKRSQTRMRGSVIRLPAKKNGEPDCGFMENYIKKIWYSRNLAELPTVPRRV